MADQNIFEKTHMVRKVMQHVFGMPNSGGPVRALERLLAASGNRYGVIVQLKAARGLNIALLYRFVREIRRFNPELIHVRGLGNEGFHGVLAAKIAGVPRILISIHGTQRDLGDEKLSLRRRIVIHLLEPLSLHFATAISTVSEFGITRDFLAKYSHKVVGYVPNGVPLPSTDRPGCQSTLDALGLDKSKPVGVCVSRVTVEKGYLILADALKILEKQNTALSVLIIGGGDEDGAIKKEFQELHNIDVRFLGERKDVDIFLAIADLFIFPTLHENLSNSLLEAMSHSLPVVATAVGGNIEVLKDGGGILVEKGNARKLADAVKCLLSDSERSFQMGREARANVEANYSLQRMVSGWEHLYEKLLDE